MYSTLVYAASADYTMQDVLSDIVAVLTGTSSVGNLSANVDPSSSIDTTIPGGWTLWDDESADTKVIRAAVTDDPTKFKYIRLYLSGGNLYARSYHTWDEVNHTGDFHSQMRSNTTSTIGISPLMYGNPANNTSIQTDQTVVLVSSSQAHVGLYCKYQDIFYGGVFLATEHTRDSLWDTVANGYNPWVYTGYGSRYSDVMQVQTPQGNSAFNKPHFPINDTTDALQLNDGGSSYNYNGCMKLTTGLEGNSHNSTTLSSSLCMPDNVLDENKQWVMPMATLGVTSQYRVTGNYAGNYGGDISSLCGFYLMPSIGGFNDVVYRGGAEYRVWPLCSVNSTTIQTGNQYYYFAVKV